MSKLRKLLQRSRADRDALMTREVSLPADGWSKGEVLRLPRGAVIAEQNVRHLAGATPQVTPLLEEAYVVMRLDDGSACYATWEPYAAAWQLLHLEAELVEPADEDELHLFTPPRKVSIQ